MPKITIIEKIYKYFFYLILLIIFLSITAITFNSDLRRFFLHSAINSYKIYMIVSIQSDLKKDIPDLVSAKKKILKFINFSKKIANGKSKLLIGIYDATNLVQSKIINEDDYGKLEEVFYEIVNLDPLLFKARVWYAKSLIVNQKKEEAIKQLNQAVKLNPLDSEAYRVLINLTSDKNLAQLYCNKYLKTVLGGQKKRYKNMTFTGFNINKFGVQFNPTIKNLNENKNEIYTFSGINLGVISQYEIIPSTVLDLESLNLLFSFVSGKSIEIKSVQLFSNDKKYKINYDDIFVTARNSFFLNSGTSNYIIFTENDDEILNLRFKKVFQDIDKILLEMKVKRLDIANKYCNFK